ncbi:hypothetical protein KP79_PYT09677 [Mizuhopecten yessoensis]|uniref:Uncharacterized protein n=1 Tax=Mizuhopecten yessoensis TaxID=6573 RepID=A0A210QCF2_MIZYE|nr:hypothetical protein KP79_PYT09677 [Mizuhopecten yessoensis]
MRTVLQLRRLKQILSCGLFIERKSKNLLLGFACQFWLFEADTDSTSDVEDNSLFSLRLPDNKRYNIHALAPVFRLS